VALLRHLVRQWRWLTGMAASLLGLALQALALRWGSLAVVQPLVVTGLIFSLLFRAALDRRRLPPRILIWAGCTAAGLAIFLAAAGSSTSSGKLDGTGAAVVLAGGAVAAVACWRHAARHSPAQEGLLLGAAAGINWGLTAGTLKATSAATSPVTLYTNWPLYVLVLLGISGFLANQRLYHRTPLTTSLPILNVTNPLVALGYGFLAFGERPSQQPALVALQVVGLLVVLLGVYCMARQGEPPSPAYPERATPGAAAGAPAGG